MTFFEVWKNKEEALIVAGGIRNCKWAQNDVGKIWIEGGVKIFHHAVCYVKSKSKFFL